MSMGLTECVICGRELEDEEEVCFFCDDYAGGEIDDDVDVEEETD